MKDPETGRRVSRANPESQWVIREVPELRIVDDDLWEQVKRRQLDIEATPAVAAIKRTRFWERRRPRNLLTGLLRCGTCGGGFAAIGRDYVACSAARKLETCSHKRSYRRGQLEEAVLELLKTRLMRPDAVAAFISGYHEEINASRSDMSAKREAREAERARIARRLDGLYDAIADGLRTPGLKAKLEAVERELSELDAHLAEPAPSTVRLHPNLAHLYAEKISALSRTLRDPEISHQALELVRNLIEDVIVIEGDTEPTLELRGELASLIELAQPGAGEALDISSAKVVAGAGFGQDPTGWELQIAI